MSIGLVVGCATVALLYWGLRAFQCSGPRSEENPSTHVEGQVLDPGGDPVPEVVVLFWFECKNWLGMRGESHSVMTDKEGHFIASLPYDQPYSFQAVYQTNDPGNSDVVPGVRRGNRRITLLMKD